jgi:hypothetical protein
MHNGLSILVRMRLASPPSANFDCFRLLACENLPDFRFSGPWDILKSRTVLDYDPDGECTYENFGHLCRG